MEKTRFIRLVKAIALCLALLLLASNAALASDMISFLGFEKSMKEYGKTAHWEPSFRITTDKTEEMIVSEEGCECIVTTRYLELFDSQESTTLKQWASFELTIEDRVFQGEITLEQCWDHVKLTPKINAYVNITNPFIQIFRYYVPSTASERYSIYHPHFDNILKHAIMFWEKYTDQ
jgi:hypothetical protein